MDAIEFANLRYGDHIWHHKTKVEFEVQEIVSELPLVRKIKNLKYMSMSDFINENTYQEYGIRPSL